VLSLDDAMRAARSVIKQAQADGLSVAIALCTSQARIKLAVTMDESHDIMAGREAMRRAIHSASTGKPSDEPSPSRVRSFVEAEGLGGSTAPGGLPIHQGGDLIGSIAVAGADPAMCVTLAKIGVAAIETADH
jgi:uncharacterized protein GlcG (DUF336 family)